MSPLGVPAALSPLAGAEGSPEGVSALGASASAVAAAAGVVSAAGSAVSAFSPQPANRHSASMSARIRAMVFFICFSFTY